MRYSETSLKKQQIQNYRSNKSAYILTGHANRDTQRFLHRITKASRGRQVAKPEEARRRSASSTGGWGGGIRSRGNCASPYEKRGPPSLSQIDRIHEANVGAIGSTPWNNGTPAIRGSVRTSRQDEWTPTLEGEKGGIVMG